MSKLISKRELLENLRLGRTPSAFEKEFLGEWKVNPEDKMPVYILASNYQIAKSIFEHYFMGTHRRIDFRYIGDTYKLYGIRNVQIFISSERYPSMSFYEKLHWIKQQAEYRGFELIYESDLEKEQKERYNISGQG